MKAKKHLLLVILVSFIFGINGVAQSFVKVYTDLGAPYYGIGVVPTDSGRTAALGWAGGYTPFTKLVDSIGNTEYTNTNYPSTYGYPSISNLTKTSKGYVFFLSYGYNNMLEPNYENLVFINDTLNFIQTSLIWDQLYASTTNINLYNVLHYGTFSSCTIWTHGLAWPYKRSSNTFISDYDSIGNLIWTTNFGPTNTGDSCQIFNSIVTTDSSFAVIGMVYDTMQLEKYDYSGNLLFGHKYSTLIFAPAAYSFYSTYNCGLIEVNNNILAFGDTLDASTGKYQLALEITRLNGSPVNTKKFILNLDTADAFPMAIYAASDTTAILNYTTANSSLNYYLIVDYKGDSISSFTLPAFTVSTFGNGNVICELDSTGTIIVKEYNLQASLVKKYIYAPSATNTTYAITPLTYPGQFVLTGSANNNLLIIRQDTNYLNPSISLVTNLICNGNNSGSATLNVTGGTAPYTYLWSPSGGTNSSASGLSAGTYTVYVTDNKGNSNNALVSITQPMPLGSMVATINSNCLIPTGTIKDSAYGGTSPYTYLWTNGRTNDTVLNLSSGSYTCTITDAHGCTKTDSIFLQQGPLATITYTNVVCNGASTGSASVTIAGNYSYAWSPAGGTESVATGLSAGTYTVMLINMDTSGCNQVYSFTLTQPAPVNATFTVTSTPCNAYQTIKAMVLNGDTPPYSYTWSYGGVGTSAGINVSCLANITTDTLFVTDKNGCISDISVNLTSPLTWTGTFQTNVSCYNGNNGTVTMQVCGGTGPYTYYWPSDSVVSYNPSYTVTGLSAGTYTVTVSDSNACNIDYVNINISQPSSPINIIYDSNIDSGSCDGSAWMTVIGGSPFYTYLWSNGSTTDSISNQCYGTYCCTVTDNHGCMDSICVTIPLATGINRLSVASNQLSVYPNPGNGIFTLVMKNEELEMKNIEVYNVLGEKVYSQLSIYNSPFTINLSEPNGVYLCRVLGSNGSLIGEAKLVIQK